MTPPDDDDDVDYEYDDPNDAYLQKINFKSIRTNGGLETAIEVQWLDELKTKLHISTLLEEKDIAPLFAGAQWAGTRVWHAAIAMFEYLSNEYSDILPHATLLELGCGLGVPGMLCHAMYGTETYLTDQESIVSQLVHNIKYNFDDKIDDNNNNNKKKMIHAMPLSWDKDAELLKKDFSIVLNCDCIYEPLYGDSWKLLADVLEQMLKKDPNTLCLTSCERRGITADGVDNFLLKLEASPHVSSVTKVWCDEEYKIEIYQAHGVVVVS